MKREGLRSERPQPGSIITARSVFQFPYMLGPASDQVEGSEMWAICVGNEAGYRFKNLIEYGFGPLYPPMGSVRGESAVGGLVATRSAHARGMVEIDHRL